MYPNPQDALPLPLRPNIEQYKKLAKDLVKSCKSVDSAAIHVWAVRWIEALAALQQDSDRLRHGTEIEARAAQVEQFARKKLSRGTGRSSGCALADAHFVIARAHGFVSWPAFAKHIELLARVTSSVSTFEAAADAIVTGDVPTIKRLLREHPALIRARSTREHRATLLHYVSANGVEGYRQKSPANAARITELLLAAGADVEAEADVYGGGCTALGLVATSTPPREAGVQIPVMEVLLEHGAQIEHPDLAGKGSDAVYACLANGCPEAASYLAERTGRVGLIGAAGIGRLDIVQQLADAADASRREMALRCAAGYGRREIVRLLLDRGVNVDGHHNDGQTALFYAILGDHLDVVRLLLERGAKSDIQTPNGPVFGAALWKAGHGGNPDRQFEIIEA